jgi:hypothetical protein
VATLRAGARKGAEGGQGGGREEWVMPEATATGAPAPCVLRPIHAPWSMSPPRPKGCLRDPSQGLDCVERAVWSRRVHPRRVPLFNSLRSLHTRKERWSAQRVQAVSLSWVSPGHDADGPHTCCKVQASSPVPRVDTKTTNQRHRSALAEETLAQPDWGTRA